MSLMVHTPENCNPPATRLTPHRRSAKGFSARVDRVGRIVRRRRRLSRIHGPSMDMKTVWY